MVSSTQTAGGLTFDYTLNQGDAKLFQLQSPLSADIRIPSGAYNNPVAVGKSVKVNVTLKNLGTRTWTTTGHHVGVHVYAPDGTYIVQAANVTGQSFGSNVAPSQTVALMLTIPTGPGSSLNQTGTYGLGFDLYEDGAPVTWFSNEQRISVMAVPNPLLVDTFEFGCIQSTSGLPVQVEPDAVHDHPRGQARHQRPERGAQPLGDSSWNDYTFEFDAMIDAESPPDSAYVGWVFRASGLGNDGYMFQLAANVAPVNPNSIRKHIKTNGQYVGSVTTGIVVKRGAWHHIKQVLSGSTIKTYMDDVVTPVDVWTDTHHNSGRVGFRLFETPYRTTDTCMAETVASCVGGANAGSPCSIDANCLGGNCSGGTDTCYPGLERGHFDNVSVYKTSGTSPVPVQVTGLAVAGTSSRLKLSWNRAEDSTTGGANVSHYRVYRSTTSGFTPGPGNLLAEPATTSYTDTSAAVGTTNYYKVKAVSNTNVEGAASAQASGAATALPPAMAVTAVANSMKLVTLTWTPNGAAKYSVHRGSAGFVPSTDNRVATVMSSSCSTTCSYDDATTNTFVSDSQLGLNAFKSYTYVVVPVSASGGVPAQCTANPPTQCLATVTTPGSKIFSDGFDGGDSQWQPLSGSWNIGSSSYNQASTLGASTSSIIGKRLANFSAEFTVQITSDPNDPGGLNWVGMTIRKNNQSDKFGGIYSGYLLYYRANGAIELFNNIDGVLATANTGLVPTAQPRRVRIDATGNNLKVFVDGTKFIDWTDPKLRRTAGFFDLTTFSAAASFRDVNIFFRDGFSTSPKEGLFFDFFEGPATQWQPLSGSWSVASSAYTQSSTSGVSVTDIVDSATHWQDMTVEFTVQITNTGGNSTNWAGMTIRKLRQTDMFGGFYTGYLIYYRANGIIELFSATEGVKQTFDTTLPPTVPGGRKVRIEATDYNIKALVWNGASWILAIDYTDPNRLFGCCFFDLTTYGVAARYQDVKVSSVQNASFMDGWTLSDAGAYDLSSLGQLKFDAPVGLSYSMSPNELKVTDFTADYAVRIDNDNGNNTRWAAFAFRKTNQADNPFTSGYMVYFRANGQLVLYGAGMGDLAVASPGVSPSTYQHIRVWAQGNRIRVYVNGTKAPSIDYTDVTSRYLQGYIHLAASETSSRFEFLEIH